MRLLIVLCLIVSGLGLSACGLNRPPVHALSLSPPVEDLQDREEPQAPVTDSEADYEAWNGQVLTWGRELRAQLARVRAWVERMTADDQPR